MKQLSSAFLIIGLLFVSCVKEDPTSGPTTAEGYVKDFITGKPIPNAEVYLTSYGKGQVGGMGTKQVDGLFADENGKFSFSFDVDPNYYYEVCAGAEHYKNSSPCTSVNSGQKNTNMEVKLSPYSYIRFHVINELPLDFVEYFHINGLPSIYNFNHDTALIQTKPAGNYKISWWLRKDGIENQYSEEFNFHPLDTIDYTIKY